MGENLVRSCHRRSALFQVHGDRTAYAGARRYSLMSMAQSHVIVRMACPVHLPPSLQNGKLNMINP
jgi:hypothetical protein